MPLKEEIVEELASYYQRQFRDLVYRLREMKSSNDLDILADEVKGISIEMHKSAVSWRLAYEKPTDTDFLLQGEIEE